MNIYTSLTAGTARCAPTARARITTLAEQLVFQEVITLAYLNLDRLFRNALADVEVAKPALSELRREFYREFDQATNSQDQYAIIATFRAKFTAAKK